MTSSRLLLAACGLACLCGCASEPARPATYPVTGTVTLKNRPLEGARVVFVPGTPGGTPATGITDREGRYALATFEAGDGAQPGPYLVKVAKYDNWKGGEPPAEAREITYEEEQKLTFDDVKPVPVAKSVLPRKYDNEGTSGLTHTVTEGPTTFDIKID